MRHISRVGDYVREFADELKIRGQKHDMSKLDKDEFELLKELPDDYIYDYGSEEYKNMLEKIRPVTSIHNKKNSHHPEHYSNGIDDMDLYDVCEMFFDWKAAADKQKNGNILESLKVGKERFNMSDQLYNILKNTAERTWENKK